MFLKICIFRCTKVNKLNILLYSMVNGDNMKFNRRWKKKLGIAVSAIGLGLLLAVFMPFWGWIILAGAVLIYVGWNLAEYK